MRHVMRVMSPTVAEDVRTAARAWIAPLVGWTLIQWTSRIQIVLDIDELDGFDVGWRVGVAGLFLLLGLLSAGWLFLGRPGPRVFGILCGWTTVYWLVRGTGILLDPGHGASFKVVHAALMATSLGLVALAVAGVRRVTRPGGQV